MFLMQSNNELFAESNTGLCFISFYLSYDIISFLVLAWSFFLSSSSSSLLLLLLLLLPLLFFVLFILFCLNNMQMHHIEAFFHLWFPIITILLLSGSSWVLLGDSSGLIASTSTSKFCIQFSSGKPSILN
jgi:hypothetical protein